MNGYQEIMTRSVLKLRGQNRDVHLRLTIGNTGTTPERRRNRRSVVAAGMVVKWMPTEPKQLALSVAAAVRLVWRRRGRIAIGALIHVAWTRGNPSAKARPMRHWQHNPERHF